MLSIIFGSLGSLQGFCGLLSLIIFSFASSFMPQEMKDQMGTQMQANMPYPVLQALQPLTEFGVAVLLLVGGIMLVKRRAQAARLLTIYAVLDLLANTYGAVIGYFAFQATMANAQSDPQMQQMPAGMSQIMQAAGPVMFGVTWLFVAIWPVFLLLWFRREKVRATVASWG